MKITADLHTHTLASGHAYSTIREIMAAAKEKGLELVAITDHGPDMQGAPNKWYFGNMEILPRTYEGMTVLYGVEANIMDREGSLDLEPYFLNKLDIVLAGLHEESFMPSTASENTRAIIKAMESSYVDIIVHPGNPAYELDQEQLVRASHELGVVLEVNNSSLSVCRLGSREYCLSLLKLIKKYKTLISLGTDAHWADQVGNFSEALKILEEAGIREDQILNTSREKVIRYLSKRHAGRGINYRL